ncbi:insulinase family protein [Ilyomonas limi]|uniref:Insulinase family protein n=1 Tax=Ilyomonas limi TaxID=2575867 RepID=A0A4U3L579_9BACT|nr:pitrilysin family protein [Ilyomonas limi]TKK70308.1 insulinase family protein [Ilyomonas limi]
MINRKVAPPIQDPVAFDLQLKPYDYYTLDNGTPVYAVNAGAQDVLLIELVFFAGNWYEQQNLVAATTNFLLKNGTRQRSAFDINEHFEFYGAYLNRRCNSETATLSLHCLSKHVNELLPVIGELLTESIFPEEELDIYKQNQKQRLQVNLKKCDFVANRLIDEYLYGFNHPYGRYTSTLAYDELEQEQLLDFFRRYYTNGRCLLFVAGKLPDDIIPQLNKSFGTLPFNKESLPHFNHPPHPAAEKVARIINDEQGVQSAIRLATPFPNRHHADYPKAQVLNSIFGGYFGSRLMSNIREDKGYTYGIHSHIENHIQTSAWVVSTEAGRDVTKATIKEVYHEMERLRNEPIGEEELYLVRNYMIGTLLGDIDGPFQIINRWKNYILHGLERDYFYKSLEVIKTITAQELQALANKYLQPEKFYELTVI